MVCCWSDSLQLSESWWNHYIWEVCLANRWDIPKTAKPTASIGQQKGPILLQDNAQPHHTTNASTVEQTEVLIVLPHPTYSPDLLPPNYHFFKHLDDRFAGKVLPQPAGCRRCFTRVYQIPKHGFLFYRNKHIYFSLAKMFIVKVPVLITKDMLEPSYNDLKFTVWIPKYVCVNLIE